MCNCRSLPCTCYQYPGYQQVYGTNMWNPNYQNSNLSTNCGHAQTCNGCLDIIKGECIQYTGSNLTNLGIDKYDTLNDILVILDEAKRVQDLKNTNILAALNDINDRLNTLEGGTPHDPYTLL